MPKTRYPLPFIVKFVLAYFYFGALSSVLYAALFAIAPKDVLFDSYKSMSTVDEIVQRLLIVVPSLMFVGLTVWTVRLFHKRQYEAVLATTVLIIASYGLFSFGELDGGVPTVAATLYSTAISAIDVAIAIYVLKSSQVKKALNNK